MQKKHKTKWAGVITIGFRETHKKKTAMAYFNIGTL
jgi:hypothetical protein